MALSQLTLLICVNPSNVDAVKELRPLIRERDVLVLEEGHKVGLPFPYDSVYPLVPELAEHFARPNYSLGRNRIFVVARPDHLPLQGLPDDVDCVLIDHERTSYGRGSTFQWSTEFEWQIEAVEALRNTQPRAGLITPPPALARRDQGWSWEELGSGFLWHNVMTQAAGRDRNRLDGDTQRWDERAFFLQEQHGGVTESLSMQLTMKPDAQQYARPDRIIACCQASRSNGVPNVLLFGPDAVDLRKVLTALRGS